MKIACVTWPINNVGGINSWTENILIGFKKLGYDVPLYYCSHQKRFKISPTEKTRRHDYDILPGYFLSYAREKIHDTIDTLNQYDLLVFMHPSPHPTNMNYEHIDGHGWRNIFYEVKAKKLLTFHDAKWEQTNWWLLDIKDHVDGAMACQKRFWKCVEDYPTDCVKWWDYHPFDLETMKTYHVKEKQRFGISASQWIKWKNHHLIISELDKIKTPIHFYGKGIEWYYLRKAGTFEIFKWTDHENFGFVEYQTILKETAKALFAIDHSIRGYTNQTHWHPLALGTTSLIERRVAEHRDTQIPTDCCQVYDLEDVANFINNFKVDNKVIENGEKLIQVTACEKIAARIIKEMS